MTLWFASGNIHKKKELVDILSNEILSTDTMPVKLDLQTPAEIGLAFGPEENGNTFLENALIKAEALYNLLSTSLKGWQAGEPIIADDSGICVDALDGRPGIHSAYYARAGIKDTGLSSIERNELLLAELGANPQRSARFVCAMVLYYEPNRFFVAQESMEGELIKDMKAARGSGGFGYDPILLIPELGRTVAELTSEEKNRLSHRGKAGKAIMNFLFNEQRGSGS